MSSESLTPTENKRIPSIDRFRGLLVFSMVFFICAAEYPCLGILARFANNSTVGRIMLFKEISLADMLDPMFVFLLSLSCVHSFNRRYQESGASAYLHFVKRYLLFMGLGNIMVSGEYMIYTLSPNYDGSPTADPALIYTVFFYIALFLCVVFLVTRFLPKFPEKLRKIIRYATGGTLVFLGVLGLIAGVSDAFVAIFGIPDGVNHGYWSILHEIGMTGLLAIPFLRMSTLWKSVSWAVLVAAYTLCSQIPAISSAIEAVPLGGLVGAFGWLVVMLGGIVLMSLYDGGKHRGRYFVGLSAIAVITVAACLAMPTTGGRVPVYYCLFSLLFGGVLFSLISLFDGFRPRFAFFTWWGKNPLPIFLVGILLRAAQRANPPSADTPLYVALPLLLGVTAILTLFAYYLDRKKIIFKL